MKKKYTKQTAAVLLASVLLSGGAVYADSANLSEPTAQLISAPSTENQYRVLVNESAITTVAYKQDKQIMVPLRETAEALGFKVTWYQDKGWAEVSLEGSPIWTLVQPNLDQYSYNRMFVELGAAPVKLNNRLFVPSQFFSDILRSRVSYEGNQVLITRQDEDVKMQIQQAVITKINNEENYKSIQANGIDTEGIIFNIDAETIIRNRAGEQIELSDLTLGLRIEVKHSLAMTLSLPGQTYAYEITALETTDEPEMLGTSGTILDVMQDEQGNKRILLEGSPMSQLSQQKIVLGLNENTILTDLAGNPVDSAQLTKDSKVLAFYGPKLAKSFPPIGQAWKIVLLEE